MCALVQLLEWNYKWVWIRTYRYSNEYWKGMLSLFRKMLRHQWSLDNNPTNSSRTAWRQSRNSHRATTSTENHPSFSDYQSNDQTTFWIFLNAWAIQIRKEMRLQELQWRRLQNFWQHSWRGWIWFVSLRFFIAKFQTFLAGEFSWMIVVMNQSTDVKRQPNYLCGGSLIHPKVVLTGKNLGSTDARWKDLTGNAFKCQKFHANLQIFSCTLCEQQSGVDTCN